MGRKKDLSPRKVAVVTILLKEKTLSQREIAQKTNVSQKTVSRIKVSLGSGNEYNHNRVGKTYRRPKLTPRSTRTLMNLCLKNRKHTSTDLKKKMADYGIDVSSRTIRRKLFDGGLKARRPRKKAKITPAMAKKRLDWAREHANKTEEDWSKVTNPNLCFTYLNKS